MFFLQSMIQNSSIRQRSVFPYTCRKHYQYDHKENIFQILKRNCKKYNTNLLYNFYLYIWTWQIVIKLTCALKRLYCDFSHNMWLHNARTSKPHYQEISINSAKSITCIATVAVSPDCEKEICTLFLGSWFTRFKCSWKQIITIAF